VAVLDLDNSGGAFNFESGTLRLTSNTTAVGGGSITIGSDGAGTLQLVSGSQNFGNVTLQGTDDTLVANGSATYQFSNLDNSAGGIVVGVLNQNFEINGGLFTHRVETGTAFFQPRIQGTGGFTKQGAGTLVFNGTLNHTYTGDTRIEGGTLEVTTSDLPTVPTFIAAGATLDLENATAGDEVGRLTGVGTVINTEFATFAVNFGGANGIFSGSITGLGDFAKRGTGKQILSGASTYTGITTVEGGTLEMATGGSIAGTSDVRISTNSTLFVNGGTVDTPDRVRPIVSTGAINIAAGLVKANQIDRTIAATYVTPFTWTGGTVHLLSAATINGNPTPAADRPFGVSLTLDSDMELIVDDTFSVTNTGTLNINGGLVTADNIVTGGTINFNSGTMRMRNDQTFDAARLAALDISTPLGAGRNLVIDGMATIDAPLTFAGGTFSAGQLINPENLILSSGTLNVTNSDLAIATATAVDVSSGMTVNVTSGALDNAGDLNVIGGAANFATASTNQAGAEINGINATLTFTGGLTNNGDVNLINSTVDGNLVNGAGSNSSLLGSNSFGNDLVLAGGDTMLIDITGDLPGQFDVVSVGGSATLDGLLSVSLSGGFSPTDGQPFTVLAANNIVDNGLVLGGPAASSFNMLIGSTSVVLQAIGLTGDYNSDGDVDAADYVVWLKNEGTTNTLPNDLIGGTIGAAHYNQWRTHFGESAGGGAGTATNASVPEPAGGLFLIFGAGFATWRGRCSASREK
jgi:autotransporter-associated beta strand protein